MKEKNEKIDLIMFNMSSYNEWQKGINNRNYQFLQNLLDADAIGKILAVDYLPFSFKRGLRNYKENVFENLKNSQTIKRTLFSKVSQLTDKLFVYSTVKTIINPQLVITELKKILTWLNFKNLINWSCFPLWIDYYQQFNEKLTVFDAVDNWAEHSSYKLQKNRLLANYQKIGKNVDLIFTVSEEVQKIFPPRPKIIWLPNGVDFSHYQNESNIINRDIGDLKKPFIGYAGVIQDKIDLELLKKIAENFPQASLILIGPVWHKSIYQQLEKYSNIHFLGYKTYQELPTYLQNFDVAIIPHRQDKFSQSTNPMKLYEYLACGKPVVTIHQRELENFLPYIYLAKNHQEFIAGLKMALSENNPLNKEKRKELVKEQTWRKRVKVMLDYIFQELGLTF